MIPCKSEVHLRGLVHCMFFKNVISRLVHAFIHLCWYSAKRVHLFHLSYKPRGLVHQLLYAFCNKLTINYVILLVYKKNGYLDEVNTCAKLSMKAVAEVKALPEYATSGEVSHTCTCVIVAGYLNMT